MRRRTGLTLLGLLLAGGLCAASAEAAPAKKPPRCNDPRAIGRYLRLTQEQVASWRTLRTELREAVDPIRDEIEPLADEVATLLEGANPDACAVGGVVVEVDGLRDQIGVLHDDYIADFEALLTPEQLAKWDALQEVCDAAGTAAGIE